MKPTKQYLYGASVQGIQSFITSTNKIKEITGASELVEKVCTTFFENQLKEAGEGYTLEHANKIESAAGKVKFIFPADSETLKHVIKEFPKHVMENASGITVSQAVVEFEEGTLSNATINTLEQRLNTQRNLTPAPLEMGTMGIQSARRTGKPAVNFHNEEYIDKAIKQKLDSYKASAENPRGSLWKKIVPQDSIHLIKDRTQLLDDQSSNNENNWIAVVHADGNNLGELIGKMSNRLKEKKDNSSTEKDRVKEAFNQFSNALSAATEKAAKYAFNKHCAPILERDPKAALPLRPVLIGGDDITIIIRADLALDFTHTFLKMFEAYTQEELEKLKELLENNAGDYVFNKGLTACAGITYAKAKYPFYYSLHLAENLCGECKKIGKGQVSEGDLTPSSLLFHKIESSFISDNFKEIAQQSLTLRQNSNYSLLNGPYLLDKNSPKSLDSLKDMLVKTRRPNAPIAQLRDWLSIAHSDFERSKQRYARIKSLNQSFFRETALDKSNYGFYNDETNIGHDTKQVTPIHDLVILSSLASN